MPSLIIADPVPLVLEGVQHILCTHSDIQIRCTCPSFTALQESMNQISPDLLLLDGDLLKTSHSQNKHNSPWKKWPATKTILISTETNPIVIRRYITEGIRGYLLKNVTPLELLKALKVVFEGDIYVQESVRQAALEQTLGLCKNKVEKCQLTKREIQVIGMIIEEYTTQEIAEKLFVSFNTIESHRKNLISKLGVKNSAGIVREAFRMRIYPG